MTRPTLGPSGVRSHPGPHLVLTSALDWVAMLLGRERERQTLDRLLSDARSGTQRRPRGGRRAGDRQDVAAGGGTRRRRMGCASCGPAGSSPRPRCRSRGLLELLRPALGRLESIPGPQADALGRALALRSGPTAQERFAVGAATLSLLAAEADDAAGAVLVDDAHWLDDSSADGAAVRDPPAGRRSDRRPRRRPRGRAVAARRRRPRRCELGGLDRGEAADARCDAAGAPPTRRSSACTRDRRAIRSRCSSSRRRRPVSASCRRRAGAGRRRASRAAFAARAGRCPSRRARAARRSPRRATIGRPRGARARRRSARAGRRRPRAGGGGGARSRSTRAASSSRHPLARSAVYARRARAGAARGARALAGALPDRDATGGHGTSPPRRSGPDDDGGGGARRGGRDARASERLRRRRGGVRARRAAASRRRAARALLLEAAESAWLAGTADRTRRAARRGARVRRPTRSLVARIDHLARPRRCCAAGPVKRRLRRCSSRRRSDRGRAIRSWPS